MSAPSRTSQLTKLHKVLKKHYQPVAPDPDRPVLEHLLLACCLENARYQVAEDALAALVHTFFDWNEIRVSTIRELSEVMAALPDPAAAASRTKRVLQHVFEGNYSFDLEDLRKANLGPAAERLREIDGTTPFSVAYVVQSALGGHAIPVDSGTLRALAVVGLVGDEDVESGIVPGLERAIPKSKGIEFGSCLHQLGAAFVANRYAPALHAILLEINPDAKKRLPKRRRKPRSAAAAEAKPSEAPSTASEAKPKSKKSARGQKKGGEESAKPRRKSKDAKRGKPASAKEPSASARKKTGSGKPRTQGGGSKKTSAAARISKRKPR